MAFQDYLRKGFNVAAVVGLTGLIGAAYSKVTGHAPSAAIFESFRQLAGMALPLWAAYEAVTLTFLKLAKSDTGKDFLGSWRDWGKRLFVRDPLMAAGVITAVPLVDKVWKAPGDALINAGNFIQDKIAYYGSEAAAAKIPTLESLTTQASDSFVEGNTALIGLGIGVSTIIVIPWAIKKISRLSNSSKSSQRQIENGDRQPTRTNNNSRSNDYDYDDRPRRQRQPRRNDYDRLIAEGTRGGSDRHDEPPPSTRGRQSRQSSSNDPEDLPFLSRGLQEILGTPGADFDVPSGSRNRRDTARREDNKSSSSDPNAARRVARRGRSDL